MISSVTALAPLPLLLLQCSHAWTVKVNNGGGWGSWGPQTRCPSNTRAVGFSLKVERHQNNGDDTALNGVRLVCQEKHLVYFKTYVESSVGGWGEWTPYRSCSVGRLKAFQLRVEGHQGGGDDTAANNVRFRCSFGQVLEGDGMGWGSWGQWSEECGQGVCGIQTRLESSQGNGDDTALNDMVLLCC